MKKLLEKVIYGKHGKNQYIEHEKTIKLNNRRRFKLFCVAQIIFSAGLYFTTLVTDNNIIKNGAFLYLVMLGISLIFLILIERWFNPNRKYLTLCCYIYIIITLVVYSSLGITYNTENTAVSICMMYIVCAMLFVDIPLRYTVITLTFTIYLFLKIINVKSGEIMDLDLLNCCSAFIIGMLTSYFQYNERVGRVIKIKDVERERDYDHLTGIRNRISTEFEITEFLSSNKSSKSSVMMVIDLDNFKYINDTYGHAAGDEVLIKFANQLRSSFRKNDYVARIGGDEFVVFLPSIPDKKFAVKKAKSLIDKIKEIKTNNESIVGCSIGIVLSNEFDNYSDMFKQADQAMYEAKSSGKNTYSLYKKEKRKKIKFK